MQFAWAKPCFTFMIALWPYTNSPNSTEKTGNRQTLAFHSMSPLRFRVHCDQSNSVSMDLFLGKAC